MKERHDEDAAIEATAQTVAAAIREHVRRAEKRAESELKAALATAEAERKALAAQHQTALADVQSQLKRSEQKVQELGAERLELQRQLKDATAAKALAETQYQQLVAASEQLTANLSRTLNEQRAQSRPPVAAAPKRTDTAAAKTAPATSSAVTTPPAPSPASAKKPIQFPGPARDTKRVRMRQGTYVSVDGIPGELVDLSLGGAQIVLTQMVKPNQVVRATIPTAGERITCRGRIVWVVYERPETSVSRYRTGVKFTDVDTMAVEDFMKSFSDDSIARPAAGIA